jgi:hypothetical protein
MVVSDARFTPCNAVSNAVTPHVRSTRTDAPSCSMQ